MPQGVNDISLTGERWLSLIDPFTVAVADDEEEDVDDDDDDDGGDERTNMPMDPLSLDAATRRCVMFNATLS